MSRTFVLLLCLVILFVSFHIASALLSSWMGLTALMIIVGSAAHPYFHKKYADSRSKDWMVATKKVNLLFLICLCGSVVYLFITTDIAALNYVGIAAIAPLGLLNAAANVFKIQSVGINMSKSYIFFQGKDIIGMALAYAFIREMRIFDPWLLLAILLCLLSGVFLVIKGKNTTTTADNLKIIFYASIFSVLWGITQFANGYFAFSDFPIAKFLTGWYLSSYLSSYILIWITSAYSHSGKYYPSVVELSNHEIIYTFMVATTTWAFLFLQYSAFSEEHMTIVLPFYMACTVILASFTGLWHFKESRELTTFDVLAICCGITSTVIIAFNC